jgi:hypothetical protein
MKIRFQIPVSLWIWSPAESFCIKPISIKINRNLQATARISFEEINKVSNPDLPDLKSYVEVTNITYDIISTANKYNEALNKKQIIKLICDDIVVAHNRLVDVVRGTAHTWTLPRISAELDAVEYQCSLWKAEYSFSGRGRYSKVTYKAELKDLVRIYRRTSTTHLDATQVDEAIEWLEDQKQVSIIDELLTQAIEAKDNSNLRLAIFNFVTALEQSLNEYLSKNMLDKLGADCSKSAISAFLKTGGTKLEDRLNILLKLQIHGSWLRSINFPKVMTAIRARNKIAHGETVRVIDLFGDVNWDEVFKNIRALINALRRATLLVDSRDEIKAIGQEFNKKFNTYPSIWINPSHNVSCEVTLYYDNKRDDESLMEMINSIGCYRSQQDARFKVARNLRVTFYDIEKKIIAIWTNGTLTRGSKNPK